MRSLAVLAFVAAVACGKEPVRKHIDSWPTTGRITCVLQKPGIIEAVYTTITRSRPTTSGASAVTHGVGRTQIAACYGAENGT